MKAQHSQIAKGFSICFTFSGLLCLIISGCAVAPINDRTALYYKTDRTVEKVENTTVADFLKASQRPEVRKGEYYFNNKVMLSRKGN